MNFIGLDRDGLSLQKRSVNEDVFFKRMGIYLFRRKAEAADRVAIHGPGET
jgi:hypothetical protein